MADILEEVRQAIEAQLLVSAKIPRKYLDRAARAAVRALWEPSADMVAQATGLMADAQVTPTEPPGRQRLGNLVRDSGELEAVFRIGWRGAMGAALR